MMLSGWITNTHGGGRVRHMKEQANCAFIKHQISCSEQRVKTCGVVNRLGPGFVHPDDEIAFLSQEIAGSKIVQQDTKTSQGNVGSFPRFSDAQKKKKV